MKSPITIENAGKATMALLLFIATLIGASILWMLGK
jgi:hypothetical protein